MIAEYYTRSLIEPAVIIVLLFAAAAGPWLRAAIGRDFPPRARRPHTPADVGRSRRVADQPSPRARRQPDHRGAR